MTQSPLFEAPLSRSALALAIVILVGLAAWVSTANFWYAYDDALITYRFARNLATGVGLVYNPGEWHLGTTAPLYALILGALGWLAGPGAIPFFGALISSLSLTLGGLALVAFAVQHRAPLAGVFAGMFYVTNPMMFITFGGEMPPQMALILWGLVAWRAERVNLAAALLACAALTRPDGLLAAAVVFGYDVVTRRRIMWRAWLVFAAIVTPFVLLTWAVYGSPLPGTLSAKLAQRDSGYWPTYFGKGLRHWFRIYLLAPVDGPRFEFFSIDPGSLSGWATLGVLAIAAYRFWALPFVWIVSFVIIYWRMKVPFYHWYAAPALVGLSIVTGAAVAALLSLARRAVALKQAEGPVLVAVGAALVVFAGYPYLRALPAPPNPAITVYTAAGRWLHDHTPPGATVGYYEIGVIGYYSDRPVVDSLGLVDPSVPPHVAKADFAWAFRERRPTYILLKPDAGRLNSFTEEPWFASEYQEKMVFAPPGEPNNHPVILYERRGISTRGGSG